MTFIGGMFSNTKTFRSQEYLAFIRDHRCLRCGITGLMVAHHEGLGKNMMGGKPPDSHTVPLCPICHAIRHSLAWESWEAWNIDVKMAIIKLLTEYIQYL